jgi:hypothetical protein
MNITGRKLHEKQLKVNKQAQQHVLFEVSSFETLSTYEEAHYPAH